MLGYFLQHVCRYRFSVCLQNMSRAFPELSYHAIRERQSQFYRNLGRMLLEVAFPKCTHLQIDPSTMKQLADLQAKQRPIILLLGHFGNWEVLQKLPQQVNIPVQALYKPLRNKWFNALIIRSRCRYGLQLLPSGQALRLLLRQKMKASITLFIADQFPGHDNGLPIYFMQQKTRMHWGAEQLAQRLGAYVGYVELLPMQSHVWQMSIHTITEDAKTTHAGEITTDYVRKLEHSIAKAPTWWLWTHRRWK